jgi:hypothetical protein
VIWLYCFFIIGISICACADGPKNNATSELFNPSPNFGWFLAVSAFSQYWFLLLD